jgi:hypothetical protein
MPVVKKNWDAVGRLITVEVPKKLEAVARDVIMENAKRYQEAILQTIESQSGGWKELTDEWLNRKDRLGGSEEIYRFHDEFLSYLESDRARQYVKGKYAGGKVFVGARSAVTHTGSGMNMEQLAYVLQYDYDRPLFEPAFASVESELVQHWKDIFNRL